MSAQSAAEYALGYSDFELQRLIRPSEFYAEFTEDVLRRAGLSEAFDALIGRFVLTFLTDPAAVLSKLVRHVRTGGIIAFQEMDIGATTRSMPSDLPLWLHCGQWISTGFQQAGVDVQMGPELLAVFRSAGLPAPQMNLHARIGGGNSPHPEYVTSVICSLLPMIGRHGVATAADIRIDTLTARLREELIRCNGVSILPSIIGAWTQKAA